MTRNRIEFLFLNIGHFLDHLFLLVFATAAALILARDWGMSYAELIPYATPGFIAFAACSIPAGWIADKWSREGMMAIFFIGIGLSSIATALSDTPLQIASGLSRFSFDLGTDTIRARFGEPISEDPAGWQFLLREIGSDHLLAASLRTGSGRPLRIEVRETVPLVS